MERKQPRVLYFSARGQLGCNPIAVNARTLKNRTSRPPRRGWNSLWDPPKRRKDKRGTWPDRIHPILSIIFAYRILKRAPPRDARTHAIRNNGDLTVIKDIYIYIYVYIIYIRGLVTQSVCSRAELTKGARVGLEREIDSSGERVEKAGSRSFSSGSDRCRLPAGAAGSQTTSSTLLEGQSSGDLGILSTLGRL